MTTLIYIFIPIAVIAVILYLNYDKLKKYIWWVKTDTNLPAKDEVEKTIRAPVSARIYDTISRRIYNTMLDGETQQAILAHSKLGLGRQWNRDGKWVYALCKEGENIYRPVEAYLTSSRENPPSKLHGFLVQPEIGVTHDVHKDKNFMQQYGHMLPWLAAIAFIIFMMVTG